jgi:hypothetical protein
MYTGPVVPSLNKQSIVTVKKVLRSNATATSDGAGLLRGAFGNNPSTASDWSNWTADWFEYRVLAFEIEYVPLFENSYPATTAAGGLLAMFVDRTSSASSPSLATCLQTDGVEYASINKKLRQVAKATGTNEMQWLNTGSPSSWCSVRYCSTALSISQAYGTFVITWLVEFRNST